MSPVPKQGYPPKICELCGKQFIPLGNRTKYCYEAHYNTCIVCGKRFIVPRSKLSNNLPKTCSIKCMNYAKGSPSRGKCEKSKSIDQICQVCGKSFSCSYIKKTCSNECRYILSVKTNQNRTEKSKQESIEKRNQTNIVRYGDKCPMRNPEILAKSRQTQLERYGETSFTRTKEYRDKSIATNRNRYGVDWHTNLSEHWEQSRKTCIEKYGVDNPGKAGPFIVDKMTHPELLDMLMSFREDPRAFISNHFDHKPTLQELSEICGIQETSIGYIINNTKTNDMVSYVISRMEDEVYRFLRSILEPDIEIIQNTFKIITPYELDIYIPEYNFGIECNPTITHNSSIPGFNFEGDKPKSKKYHQMKTDMCESKEIFLFHIFGYEWTHKKYICMSMIRNVLGCTEKRIYARQCKIIQVSDKECKQFLIDNHRQGIVASSIRLGLVYDDEIVSIMTFGVMRNTIGTGKSDLSDCYELSRFCNKLNTNVVGGASKLFKYFLSNFSPKRIRSFSDRAHTKGNLYKLLGFNEINRSESGYVWVNLKTDIAYSRINSQKQNIVNFLKDTTIDLSKSEAEIMIEHGYVQVFDSGTITWEYSKEE